MDAFKFPTLRGDQRFLFLGKTRSGKSYLARYLLKLARSKGWRIVIIDPKKDWQGRGEERRPFAEKGNGTVDSPILVTEFRSELAVQIFQPVEWNLEVGKFCTAIYQTGNTIVYFDEITQLVDATRVPTEFNILWTQGAAINIGAWCGTQRPKRIPIIVKDQAEWWFLFRIISYEDRQVIEGYVPVDEVPEMIDDPVPPYWFWFWQDNMERPVLVKPLNLEHGRAA